LADTNDIGFTAVRIAEGKNIPAGIYFRVLLCGITGHKQFATDCGILLHPEQLVAVAAAMVRVFAEHGDRTDRKKARLKYLVDRWGMERFLQETEKKLAFPVLYFPKTDCEARGAIDRAGHLGVHPQKQAGLSYVGVCTPVGWLTTEKALALSDVADRFGNRELRLTVWQNLLLPNIATQSVSEVCSLLSEAGVKHSAGRVMSGAVACTGSRGCRFAATDTKGHALEVATLLDNAFVIDQPLNLHVTGCAHSCAQHYIGDIGLMGVKIGGEDGYQVNLGGGSDNDQAIARELFPALPYNETKRRLHQLLATYLESRFGGETFLQFSQRHTLEALQVMCERKVAIV
ncbi:MAG: NirA family protein, partial [Acidobacteriaceae bacterium]